MFLLAWEVGAGGRGAKVETEVGVQVEAGAESELYAPFYASSLPLAPPAPPTPLLPALARDDDDCFADNVCVCGEGAWPELKQFA